MISQGEDQIEIFRVSVFPGESSGKGADGASVLVRLIIKMATLDKQSTNPHLTHVEMERRENYSQHRPGYLLDLIEYIL